MRIIIPHETWQSARWLLVAFTLYLVVVIATGHFWFPIGPVERLR